MAKGTMKDLRAKVEAALDEGVNTKGQLMDLVPTMVELQTLVKIAEKLLKETKESLNDAIEACSVYASEHMKHVFGDSYAQLQSGVETGDIEIDGKVYHFASGFDGYRLIDKSLRKTKEYLATLPKGWTKQTIDISTTGINQANPTADELAEYGLEEKPKYLWGLCG